MLEKQKYENKKYSTDDWVRLGLVNKNTEKFTKILTIFISLFDIERICFDSCFIYGIIIFIVREETMTLKFIQLST